VDIPIVKLNAIQVLGIACFGLVIGRFIKRLLPVLDRLNIPGSVLGGLVYAVAVLSLRDRLVNFDFDMVLRDILMIAFFTTVGMAASLRLLKIGGKRVAIFLGAAVVGLLAQMTWGAAAAKALGFPALMGIIPGAVSLTGGPATALAFGPAFEAAGVTGASALGLASAVFGIVASGLTGGFVGGYLVRKHNLTPDASASDVPSNLALLEDKTDSSYLVNIISLAVAMALGSLLSAQFTAWQITLPAYIGSMIVAGILRNVDDAADWFKIDQERMDEIGGIALEIFIVMALLTLRLWELKNLALPVLGILIGQVVLTIGLAWTLIFILMGRNYVAATMSAGYTGFMLGTTANAMACMNEIVRKFGPAPQAFFAVSIVGAFLIDFINALLINGALNFLR